MNPIEQSGTSPLATSAAADAAQATADRQAFQAEYDRLLMGMAQGVMSIVLEEMQQMATSED